MVSNLLAELAGAGAFEIGLFAFLAAAGLSILLFAFLTGVPPMPSDRAARAAMLALAAAEPARRIYELGSGWGGLAFALARRFPEAEVVAYERSPVPWAVSRLRQTIERPANLSIRFGDFLAADLSDGDLFVCYLMPGPMRRLAPKLAGAMRPGTRLISKAFALDAWVPEQVVVVAEAADAPVYLYRRR